MNSTTSVGVEFSLYTSYRCILDGLEIIIFDRNSITSVIFHASLIRMNVVIRDCQDIH